MKLPQSSTRLEELITGLTSPAAYPHAVQPVKVVQTHISCVFLTGEYAYKIKKPVDFGFLDYRTLEQRRACCEEEVRLNRRLCPDLYLGILPIVQDRSGLHVGGEGVPIEWAVQMRQFHPDETLSSRLERGEGTIADIRRIGRALADFHSVTPTSPEIREWGAWPGISKTIRNTLESMDSLAERLLTLESRSAIRRHLLTFLDDHRELLNRRMAGDCIRDCHGDLRTQNICLDPRFSGGIQIFDCIEFNHEFRYIDTAADLAYLAMDLDLAGRTDLRDALLGEYLTARTDPDLRQVLPFYQAYRACVRGNIALFAASEREVPASEREAHRETASAAYDLARSYSTAADGPALLIMIGFSGSGKSTLARELSRRLPAILISTDQVRKARAGVPPDRPLPADRYTASGRADVYQEMYRLASVHLSNGRHVILDGTFLSEHERENAAQLAQANKTHSWMVECRCPDAVIRQRLASRQSQSSASDANIAVYERQAAAFTPIALPRSTAAEETHHLIVDTEQPSPQAARYVIDRFTHIRNTAS